MKSIQEILTYCLGDTPPPKFKVAANYLQGQLKHVPEDKQLEWAKERRDRDVMGGKYGLELTRYYVNNELEDHFTYDDFLYAAAMLCIEFYDRNGGEMSAMTKRALERSSSEFGYGGEGVPNAVSEDKEIKPKAIGSGPNKLIVSSIL